MLLFYKKVIKDLQVCGFELNPYNQYVANKIFRREQMTITWHVDDLKMSQGPKRNYQVCVVSYLLHEQNEKPDEDNWGMLKHILRYLKGMRYLKFKFTVETLNAIKSRVGASYNVHSLGVMSHD